MLTSADSASHSVTAAAPTQADRYFQVRQQTDLLAAPLSVEDCLVQSMPDASPVKWHLAHTTWFFETFVLAAQPGYVAFHPEFSFLFNSYYNAVGERHPRSQRGLLTRPSLEEVRAYRQYVDVAMGELLTSELPADLQQTITLGLHHEQQHQELILTDVKHLLAQNPLWPAYEPPATTAVFGKNGQQAGVESAPATHWQEFPGGLVTVGVDADRGDFSYDNESPAHSVYLQPFAIANRSVNVGEYLAFMADGGYRRPELWLSEGWDAIQQGRGAGNPWNAPLYWIPRTDADNATARDWQVFTLQGLQSLCPADPVCHLSYYEADAFARWANARLPTEAEWETAANSRTIDGHFAENGCLHPSRRCVSSNGRTSSHNGAAKPESPRLQMLGDVWEWTQSPYTAYPGYRPAAGALGEYNGKFMCSQIVLRGGSCATPRSHIRPTYRNFFPPSTRWQFSGLRLARDVPR